MAVCECIQPFFMTKLYKQHLTRNKIPHIGLRFFVYYTVMSFFEIFVIALGLAMDAFAVAIANGAAIKNVTHGQALLFGGYFGGFQAAMSLIGWLVGRTFAPVLNDWGGWVAFALLTVVGVNMFFESKNHKESGICKAPNEILRWGNMTLLAVATSIDALMAGVGMAVMNVRIVAPSLVIGVTAFVLSFFGALTGNKLNKIFKNYSEMLGGAILIAIALKILLDSL